MLNIEIENDLNNWNYTLKTKLKLPGMSLFDHWIIRSIDSFERLIHSEMKQVTVFMNGESWITDSLDSFKRSSFMNETTLCLLLEMR